MDGRVSHPRTRKEMAYVIALGGKMWLLTTHISKPLRVCEEGAYA